MTFPVDDVFVFATDEDLTPSAIGYQSNTAVSISDSGTVEAHARWARPKMKWTLSWINAPIFERLFFINEMKAGFKFVPNILGRESDYTATNEPLAVLTSNTFQLQVTRSTTARSVVISVKYPISGTVSMTVSGSPVSSSDYSVNYATGVVTFLSPPAATPHGAFHWAWGVRFVSDSIDVNVKTGAHEIRSVLIEEVF